MVLDIFEDAAPVWIMQWTHLFKVSGKRLLNSRVVPKVNRLDLTSETALVDRIRLPGNSVIAIASN